MGNDPRLLQMSGTQLHISDRRIAFRQRQAGGGALHATRSGKFNGLSD
jgi:hypothetical protein